MNHSTVMSTLLAKFGVSQQCDDNMHVYMCMCMQLDLDVRYTNIQSSMFTREYNIRDYVLSQRASKRVLDVSFDVIEINL